MPCSKKPHVESPCWGGSLRASWSMPWCLSIRLHCPRFFTVTLHGGGFGCGNGTAVAVLLRTVVHDGEWFVKNGGGRGWDWDPDLGEKVMPKLWQDLLEWFLLGPEREPKFQYEWAEQQGCHPDSVRRIKRDPRFFREWDRRAAELNVHPERTQSVIDALHSQAVGGSVQAASLYLQYIEKFTPKRKVVVGDGGDVSDLTDLALADELDAQVSHLRVVGE